MRLHLADLVYFAVILICLVLSIRLCVCLFACMIIFVLFFIFVIFVSYMFYRQISSYCYAWLHLADVVYLIVRLIGLVLSIKQCVSICLFIFIFIIFIIFVLMVCLPFGLLTCNNELAIDRLIILFAFICILCHINGK